MDAVEKFGQSFSSVFPGVTTGHMLIAAIALLLLAVVFICVAVSKIRRVRELEEENAQVSDKLRNSEEERDRISAEAKKSRDKLTGENERIVNAKDDIIADLNAQLDVLRQFRERYQSVPDAEKEASRILNDAKNKAFIVANRTEKEYIELIDHANKEAESIRQLAQERLTRSHETLKNAIARANEIVDEARTDAARAAGGVTYVASPARIEAPSEDQGEDKE